MKIREMIASVLSVAAVVGAFAVPFGYQKHRMEGQKNARTIVLTGIATKGIWTEDEVNGFNYWMGDFKPAEIRLEAGEQVHLILRSADVVHRFYMPELGIGPIELIPGHTEVVNFQAKNEGIYPYYCTAVCGDCHFHMLNMRGLVAVGKAIDTKNVPIINEPLCMMGTMTSPLPSFVDITQKGHFLFQTRGCVTCHGVEGAGGVPNFNYARGTVPALNTLASKMNLQSKDEVDAFTKVLEKNQDPDQIKTAEGISDPPLVLAEYKSVVKTIQGGSPPLKADPNGPEPPLFMPSWRENLDLDQMNSIIAYLISQQKFEEHTGWGN